MTLPDPSATFRQEARELLDQLEQALLDLDQRPHDQDLVDAAFRALHTIKGSGAMFGFEAVATFVHEFETAFDNVRKGKIPASPALVSVALTAKDHILKLIERPDAQGGTDILAALGSIVETGAPALSQDEPTVGAAQSSEPDLRTWRVRFRLPADALVSGANPLLLLDEMRSLGPCDVTAITDAIPLLDQLDTEVCYFAWDVVLTTDRPREAIEDVFMFMRDDMELAIEPVAVDAKLGEILVARGDAEAEEITQTLAKQPRLGALLVETGVVSKERLNAALTEQRHMRQKSDAEAADKPIAPKANASIRVPAERLDELMDRVGELVIAQARLNQIASASGDSNLKTIAEELERLSSGLRDTTMGIRMVPIGTIFGRFRRLIHDLARDLSKEVEFVTSGEETELDKTMIERLADPLVHVIRNAVDHGIEAPSDRVRAGKPAKGTVRLAAIHAGGEVAIAITDDGAGMNAARVRAKAEEAGLITPDAKLTDSELFQFVFHPGFSTAREVTSVSGRGVGMDVVKRTIDSLRGSIDLTTVPGKGTTTTLRLPLTMAIIDGMLVRVGAGRYTIPLSAVEECVELPIVDAQHSGRSFLNIRGSLVPFLRLRELFKTKEPPEPYPKVVIVSSGDFRVGLVLDQIIGNNQTVIKSLSKLHAGVQCFSGATILGDGAVALILDVPHLVSFGQAYEERLRGRAA